MTVTRHAVDHCRFEVSTTRTKFIHVHVKDHPPVMVNPYEDLADVIDVLIQDGELSPDDADIIGVFIVDEFG